MRSRAFTCLLLGMWLAGGLLLEFVAAGNLRAVERTLRDPQPSAAIRILKLGAPDARMLLRYQAAEQNRAAFETWENVQLLGGLLFFFYLLFATTEDKFALALALLLVLVVALQRFLVTPELNGLGRLLDFVPESAPSAYRGRYGAIGSTYLGMEIGKGVLQLGLAAMVMSNSQRRSRHSRRKLDVIDKTDDRHVNR
ncbi:MAG TPA: hypothetical protein VKF41_05080 [Bryobacteraceae bacterium]|nr:hypothetical protein [Bryobacteraceae bacterium]